MTLTCPRRCAGESSTPAEGNPLFVEQLLSMLIDDGLLEQQEGRWIRGR